MNLYHKYRPSTFNEIVGNHDVVEYLERSFTNKDTPQVFLLHGPTGCGKTTIARIIATKLGSEELDLREINTADFRGIDTVRDMIRSSRYKGISGESRVWIIDEVHKMTNDAQNALLKLLEDPPPSSYFILCTTEKEKLLKTIVGRCISLQVNPLSEEEMFSLLRRIVKGEGKKIGKSVYDQIILDSFGLPRNAIQILQKVLSVSSEMQMEMAKESASEYSQSIELCRELINKGSWKKVSRILQGLKDQDAESIRRHILGYAQSVLLNGDNSQAAHVIEEFWEPLFNIGYPGLVYACYSSIKT